MERRHGIWYALSTRGECAGEGRAVSSMRRSGRLKHKLWMSSIRLLLQRLRMATILPADGIGLNASSNRNRLISWLHERVLRLRRMLRERIQRMKLLLRTELLDILLLERRMRCHERVHLHARIVMLLLCLLHLHLSLYLRMMLLQGLR